MTSLDAGPVSGWRSLPPFARRRLEAARHGPGSGLSDPLRMIASGVGSVQASVARNGRSSTVLRSPSTQAFGLGWSPRPGVGLGVAADDAQGRRLVETGNRPLPVSPD